MTNEQTERYKKELMQFYEIQKRNSPPDIPAKAKEILPETDNVYSDDEKYPEPELPDYITPAGENTGNDDMISEGAENNQGKTDLPAVSEAEDSLTYGNDIPQTGSGIIRVEVSTGNNAFPVEDAFVVITKSSNGQKELVAALLTNQSGETISVNIPAPSADISNNIPFATVDIETSKKGFQTSVNLDVPVYSGVTSIQPVNLIPVPAGEKISYEHKIQRSSSADPEEKIL